MKKYSEEEKREIRETRRANFKRFKRNLRLAKRRVHFRVWKKDLISGFKASAKDITCSCLFAFKGFSAKSNLFKKSVKKVAHGEKYSSITIRKPLFSKIGYVYIKFYHLPPKEVKFLCGENERSVRCDYLHQVFDVRDITAGRKLKIVFGEEVKISRIFVFSRGEVLPKWVQKWERPCERADMLAMSTHSDDEQLFFAGVLPLYIAKGKKVQLSYFAPPIAEHRYTELLDGLWQIGVKNYPVFSGFAEGWSTSIAEAKEFLRQNGTSEEDIKKYIVQNVRRFRPKVVIGQDPINGEYGHGQHAFFAKMLEESAPFAGDPSFDKESADKFGAYSLPKLYLHLYPKNEIILNLDEPMKELDGLTPFQVSQEGFSKHRTQYVMFFPRHLYGTIRHPIKEARQVKEYSPTKWGLAYATVGEGKEKNDMFENIE